jgi:hypothetical protein
MKVMCIYEGRQEGNPNEKVYVGEIYEVIRILDGWKVLTDNEWKFYELKGKPERVYAVRMFAPLSDIHETIQEVNTVFESPSKG